jgi:hypothetical protein
LPTSVGWYSFGLPVSCAEHPFGSNPLAFCPEPVLANHFDRFAQRS